MATVGRSPGKQSIHDRVIALVAQHWANPSQYNIATNPGSEKNRWAGLNGNYPDLVGWVRDGTQDRLVWVAEVETEESVSKAEAQDQWRSYGALPVPFYLVVPKGYGSLARQLPPKAGVTVGAVYEYSFVDGRFQLAT